MSNDNTVGSPTRYTLPHDVPSGSTVTFKFDITGPDLGTNILPIEWKMIEEGKCGSEMQRRLSRSR